MVLDAMRHCVDSLDYLRFVKNQSVFNFCAIPATMAMATLALCFGNEAMFQRNIKIRKAAAATVRSTAQPHRCPSLTDIPSTQLILNSTKPPRRSLPIPHLCPLNPLKMPHHRPQLHCYLHRMREDRGVVRTPLPFFRLYPFLLLCFAAHR